MTVTAIDLPMEKIAEFCDRWQVTEFALFGSVLRADFSSVQAIYATGSSISARYAAIHRTDHDLHGSTRES